MKVFFDSNVIIDALSKREGYVEAERRLLYAAVSGEFEGVISAKQITDIYYILRKYINDDRVRRDLLSILLNGLLVVCTDKGLLVNSLESNITDYEDAVIVDSAAFADASYIVTKDIKGFSKSPIPPITPAALSEELHL